MAEVVHECERFDQVSIQSQLRGDRAGDLRDLDGMRKPVAEMIGIPAGEDLRLCFQPSKSAGMHHAVPVALEVVPVRMRGFGMSASAGVLDAHRIISQHGKSLQELSPVELVILTK
jgi:hypothetical protein